MGIFSGRGSGTAKHNGNKERWSVGALALGLALVMGAFVTPGEASGMAFEPGWIPVPPCKDL